MTTLAQKVKAVIETDCPQTFSLYAGYGMRDGEYVRFPVGAVVKARRNDKGRYVEYRYADGSRLLYRYSAQSERYTLTASA